MVPETEGGVTKYFANGEGEEMSIFDAANIETNTPLVILAGQIYTAPSSRDWAIKGTRLLGVKAVVAASFERIHRSTSSAWACCPCNFLMEQRRNHWVDGSETFRSMVCLKQLGPAKP